MDVERIDLVLRMMKRQLELDNVRLWTVVETQLEQG